MNAMYNRIPANPIARELYVRGLEARDQAIRGIITYEQARLVISQYVEYANMIAKEIAKKNGIKYKTAVSVGGFLR